MFNPGENTTWVVLSSKASSFALLALDAFIIRRRSQCPTTKASYGICYMCDTVLLSSMFHVLRGTLSTSRD